MNKKEKSIRNMRHDYVFRKLEESNMDPDPVRQFEKWLTEAIKAGVKDPNAMTLATTGTDGFPQARVVLLRGVDQRGLSFFTNYRSAKAKELENSKACVNFFWLEVARQVRITGVVKKTSTLESNEYFASRPRESQLAAWASEQSTQLPDRKALESRYEYYENKYKNKRVPRPPYWGGYLLNPLQFEFWQGRENRMHDRIIYTKLKTDKWITERLAP